MNHKININKKKKKWTDRMWAGCLVDWTRQEKLVFMSAGISDLKQSQAGGLSKDLGAEGFNGLLPFL